MLHCFILEEHCDADWKMFNQSCYKLVMNYSDIRECRKDCQKEGADLASVHSKDENDFIVSLLEESPTWIAGSITEEDGDFFWLDGSAWDFESWDEGGINHKL
jgi:C-type mannose receptor